MGKEYWKNWSCVSSEIRLHDVVEATDWLKLRACPPVLWGAWAMKCTDADTVTGGGYHKG